MFRRKSRKFTGRRSSSVSRRGRRVDPCLHRRLLIEKLEDRRMLTVGAFELPPEINFGDTFDGQSFDGAIGFRNTQLPLSIPSAGGGGLLSTGRHVLTAGHVAGIGRNGVEFTSNIIVGARNHVVHPDYDLFASFANDIGVVELSSLAPITAERYDIYRNSDEIGQRFQFAGAGHLKLGDDTSFTSKTTVVNYGENRFGITGDLLDTEVVSYVIDGNPTGGSWQATLNGQASPSIPLGATAAQVESAIEALVGQGNVSVNFDGAESYFAVFNGNFGGVDSQGWFVTENLTSGTIITRKYGDGLNPSFDSSNLFSDFDDGTPAHDALGLVYGINDLGVGAREANTQNGDSGSPAFIDGKIAAVVGGGFTFGKEPPDLIPGTLDSNFGEFTHWTRVSSFASWIDAQTSGNYDLALNMQVQPATALIGLSYASGEIVITLDGQELHRDSIAKIDSYTIVGTGSESVVLDASLDSITGLNVEIRDVDDVIVNGSLGVDNFRVHRSGGQAVIERNGTAFSLKSPFASALVNSGNGTDSLTIDYSDGDPLDQLDFRFEAGSGTDSVTVVPGTSSQPVSFNTLAVNVMGTDEGQLVLDGSSFEYAGVELVEIQPDVADVAINVIGNIGRAMALSQVAGQNDLLVAFDGSQPDIRFPNPVSFVAEGGDGDDSLTVDLAEGLYDFDITYHGGNQATTAGDVLVVSGGIFPNVTHTSTTTGPGNSGQINYDDGIEIGTINYTGLEPVDMTGSTISDLTFNLPSTADVAVLEDDGVLANGNSQLRSVTGTFETTVFGDVSSLTVNLGEGSDQLTINRLPDFTGTFLVDGQNGNDAIHVGDISDFAGLTILGGSGVDSIEDRFTGNDSLATAGNIGVAPGIHINDLGLGPETGSNWFQFELLRPDDLDVRIDFDHSQSNLDLEVLDASGNSLGTSTTTTNQELVSISGLAAGTYYARVDSPDLIINLFDLSIDPSATSTTSLYYINDGLNDNNVYSLAAGDDVNDGLTPLTPKGSLQSVLDDYNLDVNSLVLVDTGTYNQNATLVQNDEGLTIAGSPSGSTFAGSGTNLELVDSDDNLLYGLDFEGNIGIRIREGAVDPSIRNIIRQNTFDANASYGIYISGVTEDDQILDNVFTGLGSIGIWVSDGMDATIADNQVSGRSTGLQVSADSSIVQNNTLSNGNARGIYVTNTSNVEVLDNDISDFGSQGVYITSSANTLVQGNDVSLANVGIESHFSTTATSVLDNTVHDNTTGIRGFGTFGPTDWASGLANDVFDNTTGIWADSNSTTQFNKIHSNVTGVRVDSSFSTSSENVLVDHNLIYRNTGQAINLFDGDDVTISNNTIYTPAGDGVRVEDNSSNVTLRNNIIWTESNGFDIYVDTDSQVGFVSNYNNLFTSGTGKIAFWQKEFTDLFDWQVEADFDNQSIGFTSVDPALDNPQFVDLANDDYRLLSATSTSIDAGDPTNLFSNEPGVNGSRINLGAYGGTADAASSRSAFIEIDSPNFYSDLQETVGSITWHTFDDTEVTKTLQGDVDIDLIEEGVGKVADIAIAPATDGSVGWNPSNLGISGDVSKRYRIRIESIITPSIADVSREVFSIVPEGNSFFVDDASDSNDQYTPAATGNNRNTGQTATDPKAVLLAIIGSYDLKPADTVFIDSGNYVHVRNTIISGLDEGARFTGPNPSEPGYIPGAIATIDRGNLFTGSTNIELNDADSVTLEYLTLTGASDGLVVQNDSDNFTGRHLTVTGNADDGLFVGTGADATTLDTITASNNGGDGIFVSSEIASLSNSFASNNSGTGISLTNQSGVVLVGNEAFDNNIGISVTNASGGNQSTIGNLDLTLGLGNKVHNNASTGISATRDVLVIGNAVFAQNSGIGIRLNGAEASQNIVHGNLVGIEGRASQGPSTIRENRVYDNADVGIRVELDSQILANQVYSNSVGILGQRITGGNSWRFRGQIENNVVYANTNQGIVLDSTQASGNNHARVFNNTVFQGDGDAVRLINSSVDAELKNNILWVEAGSSIFVDSTSQQGFDSDFNLLFATNTGQIGNWQSVARGSLIAWQNASFTDQNSLSIDPLFVDRDGADDLLGFIDGTTDGRDDDFHLMSSEGRFTGALAPVLDATSGLPLFLASNELIDVMQSPAIDRGDAIFAFANEPSPNGNFINIGAYGNTPQASKSPAQYVLVTNPDGGEAWPALQAFDIQWRSDTFDPLTFVDVELVRDSDAGFSFLIADDTLNDGLFSWSIPDDPVAIPPATDYRVQITRTDDPLLVDTSNNVFEITGPITTYFVNDGSLAGDEYTFAIGDDANDGLTVATPKASISSVLATFDLGPGDVILVDSGNYTLTTNIVITSDDSGVFIQGPTTGAAILDRANTSAGSYVFELVDADDVTLSDLTITGANTGIFAGQTSDSDNLTVQNSHVTGNSSRGIELLGNSTVSNDNGLISGNTISNNGSSNYSYHAGIRITSSGVTISGNTISDNMSDGIIFRPAMSNSTSTISGNTVFGNSRNGIDVYLSSSAPNSTATISGNTVFREPLGIR